MTTKRVGHRYYGKTKVDLIGQRAWDRHDAAKTWSDGGEVRETLEALIPRLEEIVARNASLSVSEYAGDGEAALRVTDQNELAIGLLIKNHEASLIVEMPLKKLMIAALTELRNEVGANPEAQNVVAQLVELGRQLSNLGGVHAGQRPPAPQPQAVPAGTPRPAPGRKGAKPKSKGSGVSEASASSRKPATLA